MVIIFLTVIRPVMQHIFVLKLSNQSVVKPHCVQVDTCKPIVISLIEVILVQVKMTQTLEAMNYRRAAWDHELFEFYVPCS